MTDVSRYEPALESSSLFIAAGKNFQQCRTHLEEISSPSEDVRSFCSGVVLYVLVYLTRYT
jgi:hypothetical protein